TRRQLVSIDAGQGNLVAFTTDGGWIGSYDVSSLPVADPQAMVFAPSGDQTDDPSTLSLFVADPRATGSAEGRVFELATVTEAVAPTEATSLSATLVRTTQTSKYSPPSPDPSGVTYDSATGHLVISDAEVEEMRIWAGKNVFETTLTG